LEFEKKELLLKKSNNKLKNDDSNTDSEISDENYEVIDGKPVKIEKYEQTINGSKIRFIDSDDQLIENKIEQIKNLKNDVLLFFKQNNTSFFMKAKVDEIFQQLKGKRHNSKSSKWPVSVKTLEEKIYFQNYLHNQTD